MRLATWNVNSARARLPRLVAWLGSAAPDVCCLQETKCSDETFPYAPVEELGYEVAHHGDGRWNGVALLSRVGLTDVHPGLDGAPLPPVPPPAPAEPAALDLDLGPRPGPGVRPEARALSATCGGIRVWSVYVPNGRAVDSPHFPYKLAWLARLGDVVAAGSRPTDPLALCGDWNVAPADEDVWDRQAFIGSTHVTPEERAAVAGVAARLGLRDVVRARHAGPGPFTYWDYRAGDFPQGRGMRIDLVLASAPVDAAVVAAYVDRDARKGSGASDHAPVVVDLAEHGRRGDPADQGPSGPAARVRPRAAPPPPGARPVRAPGSP